jgi:O-antigen ligase
MTGNRIHGFQGHWMNFGGQQMLIFAAMMAMLLLSRAFLQRTPNPESRGPRTSEAASAPGNQRVLWGFVLALVALSIVLNFTRGVWFGCFIATLYLVGRWNPRWLWVLPVLVVAGYFAAPSLVRQRVTSVRHPSTDPALSIRFEMWGVGLRMIEQHPLLGVGPNNIPELYTLYLAPGETPQAGYRDHMHNNFIQLAAERGLPCLAAWVWFVGALGWHSWRIARQRIQPRWIADAAVAGWLAFVAEGFFEYNFGTSPVLMLFLFVTATPFVVERIGRTSNAGAA